MDKGFKRAKQEKGKGAKDNKLQCAFKYIFCPYYERNEDQSGPNGKELLRDIFTYVPERPATGSS